MAWLRRKNEASPFFLLPEEVGVDPDEKNSKPGEAVNSTLKPGISSWLNNERKIVHILIYYRR
jgi:hypothetical protein